MLQPHIFKSNDIRGIVLGADAAWDQKGAFAIGQAYAQTLGLSQQRFALGRDIRRLGKELSQAFIAGAQRMGAEVLDVGLTSTDQLWFVSGSENIPGVQFTASHNPTEYNGVKFCLAGAAPVSASLLQEIKRRALEIHAKLAPDFTAPPPEPMARWDSLPAYAAKLHSLIDLTTIRPLRVVVDAGNGMAGLTTAAVLGKLGVDLIEIYTDLDGAFPNHLPNPLDPENLRDAQSAVKEQHADLALVFDGDADRCFIIDENGAVVNPAMITALIAENELEKRPGGAIVVNTITSRAVREGVEKAGGRIVVSPVGHTHVKSMMVANDAIFGGEHSAHYYFADFWYADTGMLAALKMISLLGVAGVPMSKLVAKLPQYVSSGELNNTVADPKAIMANIVQIFGHYGEVDESDGVFIHTPNWWLSVRESNTEPLLRLNVEADDEKTMIRLRDEALAIITKEKR